MFLVLTLMIHALDKSPDVTAGTKTSPGKTGATELPNAKRYIIYQKSGLIGWQTILSLTAAKPN